MKKRNAHVAFASRYPWSMETRDDRIARLEAEADDEREQIALHNARLGAILREMELLRGGLDVVDVEMAGTLKEAVLAVLRESDGGMAPADVTVTLRERGRYVHVPSIRGTLNSPKKDGLETRAASKRWVSLQRPAGPRPLRRSRTSRSSVEPAAVVERTQVSKSRCRHS